MVNNPTEWSKRMSPRVIGTAYISNLYRRIYPQEAVRGDGSGRDVAGDFMRSHVGSPDEIDAQFNEAYNTERLPVSQNSRLYPQPAF